MIFCIRRVMGTVEDKVINPTSKSERRNQCSYQIESRPENGFIAYQLQCFARANYNEDQPFKR